MTGMIVAFRTPEKADKVEIPIGGGDRQIVAQMKRDIKARVERPPA
jgi:hypothetical protein